MRWEGLLLGSLLLPFPLQAGSGSWSILPSWSPAGGGEIACAKLEGRAEKVCQSWWRSRELTGVSILSVPSGQPVEIEHAGTGQRWRLEGNCTWKLFPDGRILQLGPGGGSLKHGSDDPAIPHFFPGMATLRIDAEGTAYDVWLTADGALVLYLREGLVVGRWPDGAEAVRVNPGELLIHVPTLDGRGSIELVPAGEALRRLAMLGRMVRLKGTEDQDAARDAFEALASKVGQYTSPELVEGARGVAEAYPDSVFARQALVLAILNLEARMDTALAETLVRELEALEASPLWSQSLKLQVP